MTTLESAALDAAKALDEALDQLAPLVERLQDCVRAANVDELRRRGHVAHASLLPCIRLVDRRYGGLRHLAGDVWSYLARRG